MRFWKLTVLVLVLAAALGRAIAMLPPETFKDPIFAASEDAGDEGEITEFA